MEEHHPAIIDPKTFDLAQAELQRRAVKRGGFSGSNLFSAKIVCGECGGYYGAKVWHSTDKYRKIMWRCNKKYSGDKKCTCPAVSETEIKAYFEKALGKLVEDKESFIEDLELLKQMASDTVSLENESTALTEEVNRLVERIQALIQQNAMVTQDQEEYNQKYSALYEKYEKKRDALADLSDRIDSARTSGEIIGNFIRVLRNLDGTPEFSEWYWTAMVEDMTIKDKETAVVRFKGKIEITVKK